MELSTLEQSSTEVMDSPATPPTVLTTMWGRTRGTLACVGGTVALLVGWFTCGIPYTALAICLGHFGVLWGAPTFGRLIKVAGWVTLALSMLVLLVLLVA